MERFPELHSKLFRQRELVNYWFLVTYSGPGGARSPRGVVHEALAGSRRRSSR